MADLQVFDITAARVQELFEKHDTDEDGELGPKELADCLVKSDLLDRGEALTGAAQMIRHVKRLGGKEALTNINVGEFGMILTRLHLAELLTPSAGDFQYYVNSQEQAPTMIGICDFNAQKCRFQETALSGEYQGELPMDVSQFFFGTRKALCSDGVRNVRWVHADATQGLDRLTMLLIAVKYHLHPLAIDDVIDNRTMTNIDRFDDHYFISVDMITLVQGDTHRHSATSPMSKLGTSTSLSGRFEQSPKEQSPKRVRIQRSHVSIFLGAPPHCETLLTIHQDRPDRSSWLAMWRNLGIEEELPPNTAMWDKLREDLAKDPPLRMRERRADFLLYVVLDRIVDNLRPIAEAYAMRLGFMHQQSARNFTQEFSEEVDEVQLELTDLSRSIMPMRQVVRRLENESEICDTGKAYLKDLEDAIVQMLGDLTQLQLMCRTLEEANQAHRDKRMNNTLFVISTMSAIFLPAQFITGVYGMNFEKHDGQGGTVPGLPELTWEYGYVYFWVLQLAMLLVGVTALFFLVHVGEDFSFCSLCCCRSRQNRRRR